MSMLREELVCLACEGILSEPRRLSCAHSFCSPCLQSLLPTAPVSAYRSANGANAASVEMGELGGERNSSDREIECPACRKVTSVPDGNVERLPPSRLRKLLSTSSSGNLEEVRKSVRTRRSSGQRLSSSQLPLCSTHAGSAQEFYCAHCAVLVCGHCMLAGHKNHIDQVKSAQEAQEKMMSNLRYMIQPSQESVFIGEEAKEKIGKLKNSIIQRSTATTTHVEQFFNRVRESLAEREAALVARVEGSTVSAISDLTRKEEVLRQNVAALSKCAEQIRGVVQQPRDMSAITETCSLAGLVEENRANIEGVFKSVSEEQAFTSPAFQSTDIDFSSLGRLEEDNTNQTGDAGYVIISNEAQRESEDSSPQSDAEYYTIRGAQQQQLTLHVPGPASPQHVWQPPPPVPLTNPPQLPPRSSFQSQVCDYRSSQEWMTEHASSAATPLNEPLYEEPYQSLKSLPARIIKRGSLASIKKHSINAVLKCIIPCNVQSTNIKPCGIAIGNMDAVIVSDIHNPSIKVIAPSGKVVDTISDSQSSHQISSPIALATNSEGHLYIVDKEGKKSILRFKNGMFDSQFSSKASRFSKLGEPCGIAASNEFVYVTDWHRSCVHIFSVKGKYKESLGCKEGQTSVLKRPMGIAVSPDGSLIVADQGNRCVWKIMLFKDSSEFLKIGSDSLFESPYGVAVTRSGYIVVTDTGSSQVLLFSLFGNFITTIGEKGSEEGSFNLPRHVYVNSKDEIFIADEGNQRIQVFQLNTEYTV